MTKLSVIIPVYNTEKYLRECLDSIVNQLLTDIEIICVNDGSTDKSLSILNEYAEKDKRVKIITQVNKGLGAARNTGLKIAKGEYVGFVDSDDWVDLDFFEKLYQYSLNKKADIARASYKYNYKDKVVVENNLDEIIQNCYNDNRDLNVNEHSVVVWNAIYRKEFLDDNNILYYEDISGVEDITFTAQVTFLSQRTIPVPDTYYHYRQDLPNQLSLISLHKIRTSACASLYVIDFLNKHNCFAKDDYVIAFKRCIWRFNDIFRRGCFLPEFDKTDQYSYLQKFSNAISSYKYKEDFNCLYSIAPGICYLNEKKFDDYIDFIKAKKLKSLNKVKFKYLFSFGKTRKKYKTICRSLKKQFNELVSKRVVVSLTSYPARINCVNQTIYSILKQSYKVDEIILWLSLEEFPNREYDLPPQLVDLTKKGLTIRWTEGNLKSYKKLFYSLKEYSNCIIITVDDDILYNHNCVESLIKTFKRHPNCIIAHRAHYIIFDKNKKIEKYKNWLLESECNKASFNLLPTGAGGVLYFPGCFYKDILEIELFEKYSKNTDDLWFWFMAVLNNTKICIAKPNFKKLNYIDNSQMVGLYKDNLENGNNDKNLDLLFSLYPEVYSKLSTDVPKLYIQYGSLSDLIVKIIKKLIQNIFSVKNEGKHKVLRILGIKIKLKKEDTL